jgi:hypothetical protein
MSLPLLITHLKSTQISLPHVGLIPCAELALGEDRHLRTDAVQSGTTSPTLRRNILPPSSGSKNKPSAPEPCLLRYSCLAYFRTSQKEAVRSSEASVNIYQTARSYFPQDSARHSYRGENLKTNILQFRVQKACSAGRRCNVPPLGLAYHKHVASVVFCCYHSGLLRGTGSRAM